MSDDPLVRCCRCRRLHFEEQRLSIPDRERGWKGWQVLVCPRCGAKTYRILKQKLVVQFPEVKA